VRYGVRENGGDYLNHISPGNRRCFAAPERQFDAVSIADTLTRQLEKALHEHCGPDRYDGQSRPCERLLAQPVLPLLMTRGGVLDALSETVIWDMLTNALIPASRATVAMVTGCFEDAADGTC
jgi:hypothetical protein